MEERVQRGMALLDEKNPGWERKIDLKILNMVDRHACILGQLYTEYSLGLGPLAISSGIPYGFNNSGLSWKQAIRQRLDLGPGIFIRGEPTDFEVIPSSHVV